MDDLKLAALAIAFIIAESEADYAVLDKDIVAAAIRYVQVPYA